MSAREFHLFNRDIRDSVINGTVRYLRTRKGASMKHWIVGLALSLLMAGIAHAHGNISNLPNSVQILQYRMLLYLNPADNVARNNLAMALFRTNKLDEAKAELDKVLKSDASNFNALDGMGIVLLKKEKYREAMDYLQKALSIKEDDMMVHVHLSAVYKKLSMPEKAAAELERAKALSKKPDADKLIQKELKLIM